MTEQTNSQQTQGDSQSQGTPNVDAVADRIIAKMQANMQQDTNSQQRQDNSQQRTSSQQRQSKSAELEAIEAMPEKLVNALAEKFGTKGSNSQQGQGDSQQQQQQQQARETEHTKPGPNSLAEWWFGKQ
jgi:hypothetical protein